MTSSETEEVEVLEQALCAPSLPDSSSNAFIIVWQIILASWQVWYVFRSSAHTSGDKLVVVTSTWSKRANASDNADMLIIGGVQVTMHLIANSGC